MMSRGLMVAVFVATAFGVQAQPARRVPEASRQPNNPVESVRRRDPQAAIPPIVADLQRRTRRQAPREPGTASAARRAAGLNAAGAPSTTMAPLAPRISIVNPRLPGGMYLQIVGAVQVTAEGRSGFAAFDSQGGGVIFRLPAGDGRGYTFDCAQLGLGAARVFAVRGDWEEVISVSELDVQDSHVFFYVPPDPSQRARTIVMVPGGEEQAWWFFHCSVEQAG